MAGILRSPYRAGWWKRGCLTWIGPAGRTKTVGAAVTRRMNLFVFPKYFDQAPAIRVPIAGLTLEGSNATGLRTYADSDTRATDRLGALYPKVKGQILAKVLDGN